jgi:predicted nucleic acid-binding Zn ribbon protein
MNITRNTRPRSAYIKVSPRQAVIAQWRGVDLAPTEAALAPTARPVKAVMSKVLHQLGLDRRYAETEILKVWNNLIDPTIIAHAQPSGIRKGTLFVTIDSSVWLNEIVRYRRKEILERLQHSFGPDVIARISFRVG